MSYVHLRRDDPSIEALGGVFLKIRRALGTTASQPVAGPDGLRFLSIGASPRIWDRRPSL